MTRRFRNTTSTRERKASAAPHARDKDSRTISVGHTRYREKKNERERERRPLAAQRVEQRATARETGRRHDGARRGCRWCAAAALVSLRSTKKPLSTSARRLGRTWIRSALEGPIGSHKSRPSCRIYITQSYARERGGDRARERQRKGERRCCCCCAAVELELIARARVCALLAPRRRRRRRRSTRSWESIGGLLLSHSRRKKEDILHSVARAQQRAVRVREWCTVYGVIDTVQRVAGARVVRAAAVRSV